MVNRSIIKILNKLLFILTKNSIKNNVQFRDFYYPQENILPLESKLFSGGKYNIQILIPKKIYIEVMRQINDICKYYKYESWWAGIKQHKIQNFINNFAIDGYDITLQWSGKYIKKTNFNNFYNELIELIKKHNCIIYLTQDVFLNKKNFSEIYSNNTDKIKNYELRNTNLENELYSRIFN